MLKASPESSGPSNSHNEDPEENVTLIPEHVVDHASQRIFVVSIFVLIQCWKIYDILLIRADLFSMQSAEDSSKLVGQPFTNLNNFTFLIKYALVDGMFLWLLPVLNIPLLSFSPFVTLLLNALTLAITVMLASDSALPLLSGIFVPMWNFFFRQTELTIVGDSVSPLAVSDMNAHFKGRYTIRYLPESSVHLNPFNMEKVCLESTKSDYSPFPSLIRLPIEFNTTTEIGLMQIQYTSPSNAVSYLNYSSYDVKRLRARDISHLSKQKGFVADDDRVFYLELPIKKPGKYKISKVTDNEGSIIRSYKSEFAVAHCPSARFVYPGPELSYSAYKCISDGFSDLQWTLPLVELYGALPLSVEVAAYSGSKKISQFTASINEATRASLADLDARSLTRNILEQELLKNTSVLGRITLKAVEFQLISVKDNLGMKRSYNTASKDRDIHHTLNLKRASRLSLADNEPGRPLLLDSSKKLHVRADQEAVLPLTVTLLYQPFEETASSSNRTITFRNKEDLAKGLEVQKEGIYSLVSGEDKYCPCAVDKAHPIELRAPQKPSAVISGVPITDKCIGDIGYEFHVDFNGTGPFVLSYEVFKNTSGVLRPMLAHNAMRRHITTSLSKVHLFQYKTTEEGNYLIVFKDVKDSNYKKHPVPIDAATNTYLTYFRKRSFYSMGGDDQKVIKLCKGGQAKIPIKLDGNAPFSFRYEIVNRNSGNVIAKKSLQQYKGEEFVIDTPHFDKGGEYDVVVKDITDKLGCPVESTGSAKVQISARSDIPKMGLQKSQVFRIVEGESVEIPTTRSLTSGDKIEVLWQDLNKTKTDKFIAAGSSSLRVTKEGVYRLLSFSQEGCSGQVTDSDRTVTVLYHPKPNLTISEVSESLSKLVCVNSPKKAVLFLEGAGPFFVDYTIKYPNGETKSSYIYVESHSHEIALPTNMEGHFEHHFTAIYDKFYTREAMSRLQYKQEESVVEYDIMGLPQFKVVKPNQLLQVCESQLHSLHQLGLTIPIAFRGAKPFLVRGTIKSGEDSKGRKFEIKDLESDQVDLGKLDIVGTTPEKVFTRGDHLVIFEDVVDANGCSRRGLKTQNSATISVTKVPEIRKNNQKAYYCVGEHISYGLKGIAPFVVHYKFNEQNRKAEVGHEFRRLAAKPGVLSIEALQDASASQCMVNYTFSPQKHEDLKLKIHDIPSVEISHGDAIIKNLHEGDQAEIVFKFIGEPPFEVTYVRTIADEEGSKKGHKKKHSGRQQRRVVDQKTIKDIWEFEHIEVVKLEGTYDAIFVKDAFCQAERDVLELI